MAQSIVLSLLNSGGEEQPYAYITMSRERTLKEAKGRCDSDVLKPAYQVQSDDAENRSANSRGTPMCQVCAATDLELCCHFHLRFLPFLD